MKTRERFVIKGLLEGGFTQEQIDAKSPEELREIYARAVRDSIQRFSPPKEKTHKPKFSFNSLQKPQEAYEMPLDFFQSLSQEDITLALHKQFRHLPIDKIQKIVKVLLCSFQEKLLAEIASKLQNIPEEERMSILEIYELQRNNTRHLVQIKQKLDLASFQEKLEKILYIKNEISARQKESDEK